jgi:DNA-binding PadR family transcriptional regulator
MREESQFLPLSPAIFYILLSVAGEDRHGYGIMQEVKRQSEGQFKLGPGTLYDNLQKLLDCGLVRDAPSRSSEEDPRRRYYRLTPFGRRVLMADVARLEGALKEARARLRKLDPRRTS